MDTQFKRILFAGHSDDSIYIVEQGQAPVGHPADVDACPDPAAIFSITASDGTSVLVCAHYGAWGCWYFGLSQVAEGQSLPPWRVSIGTDDTMWNDYTAVFIIEVPADAVLKREAPIS